MEYKLQPLTIMMQKLMHNMTHKICPLRKHCYKTLFSNMKKCQLSFVSPYVQPLQTTPMLGMKTFYSDLFFWGVGWDTNKIVGVQVVIA